jgi:prepilin-type N-terminal cleavage/methylation domain-containing protein
MQIIVNPKSKACPRVLSGIQNPKSFTLIELLVVVAIIAVLVSILLPALANAREQARKVVCASNLNQLAKIFAFYQADYQDWLCPPEDTYIDPAKWYDPNNTVVNCPYPTLIRKYTNDTKIISPTDTRYTSFQIEWGPISGNYWGGSTILQCPSNPNKMPWTFSVHYAMNNMPWVYNEKISATNYVYLKPHWWTVGAVRQPARVAYMFESDASGQGTYSYNGGYGHRVSNNHLFLGQWHFGGNNVMYFDGHTNFLSWYQMENACNTFFDSARNSVVPPWYSSD